MTRIADGARQTTQEMIAKADRGEVTYRMYEGWNVDDREIDGLFAAGFVVDYAGTSYPVRMVRR